MFDLVLPLESVWSLFGVYADTANHIDGVGLEIGVSRLESVGGGRLWPWRANFGEEGDIIMSMGPRGGAYVVCVV